MYQAQFFLFPRKISKHRVTGDLIGMMSEIGGLMKILQAGFNIATYPISHFFFVLVMIRRMYFAKTTDSRLFKDETVKPDKPNKNSHHGSKFLQMDRMPLKLKRTTFAKDMRLNQ